MKGLLWLVVIFCTFNPHQQRVTHAAITENKHLSAVLAHIKEEQEKAASPPKVKPVSAKNGYQKTGKYQRKKKKWRIKNKKKNKKRKRKKKKKKRKRKNKKERKKKKKK